MKKSAFAKHVKAWFSKKEQQNLNAEAKNPWVWAAAAVGGTGAFVAYGAAGGALGAWLAWGLAALTAIDLKTQTLPNSLTLPLMAVGLATAPLHGLSYAQSGLGLVIGGGSLWAIAEIFRLATGKNGMGMGDMKLLGALGTWVGAWGLLPLVLGASWGQIGLHMGFKQKRLPFGPALATAGFLTFLALPKLNQLLQLLVTP